MLNRFLIPFFSLLVFVFVQAPGAATAQDATSLQIVRSLGDSSPIHLTLAELDGMEPIEFSTSTIWTDDVVTFSGVSLSGLLKTLETSGQTIELVALNEYSISIPSGELGEQNPIVATRMNGEKMSVRDKGPFWLVYNYDSDPRFQNETIYSRSIWQLNRIKVME